MSRTYALALIFAAVTLVSGLFYGQYWYLTSRQAEVAAYAVGVHGRVVEGQLDRIRQQTNTVSELLADDSKERFRPILVFAADIEERREAYLKLSRSINTGNNDEGPLFEKLVLLHEAHLNWLEDRTANFLLEHGEQMDLSEREITTGTEQLKLELDKYRGTVRDIQETKQVTSLQRDLLTVDYLDAITLVLLDVYQMTGGRTLICFPPPEYFPVINNGFSDPKLGETITTSISIGKLDYSHHPDNMIVLINGDTLKMGDFSRQPYSFKPKRRGKQVLEMELLVRNPLTGEFYQEGRNYYDFHVR